MAMWRRRPHSVRLGFWLFSLGGFWPPEERCRSRVAGCERVVDEGGGRSGSAQHERAGPLARGSEVGGGVDDEPLAGPVDIGSAAEQAGVGDAEVVQGALGRAGLLVEFIRLYMTGGDIAGRCRAGRLCGFPGGGEYPAGCLGRRRDLPDSGRGLVARLYRVGYVASRMLTRSGGACAKGRGTS